MTEDVARPYDKNHYRMAAWAMLGIELVAAFFLSVFLYHLQGINDAHLTVSSTYPYGQAITLTKSGIVTNSFPAMTFKEFPKFTKEQLDDMYNKDISSLTERDGPCFPNNSTYDNPGVLSIQRSVTSTCNDLNQYYATAKSYSDMHFQILDEQSIAVSNNTLLDTSQKTFGDLSDQLNQLAERVKTDMASLNNLVNTYQ